MRYGNGAYTRADDDGDGTTKDEGDCNDADSSIEPGNKEVDGNLLDDDCDGVADQGKDESDADKDGYSILAGDCDDTRAEVYPGAPEEKDSLDNDCDLQADEDYANRVWLNDGTGLFTTLEESGVEAVDQSTAAAFADGNRDGLLDIYWGNWLEQYPNDPAVQDRYFEGLGGGLFVDVQEEAGLVMETPLSCYGVIWCDYNNDGWQDIYVGNYHLYANQLWQNQGDGTFVDVAEELGAAFDDIDSGYPQWPGGHSYGGDWGDYDNDGDVDYFMANLAHPRVQPWSDPSMFLVNLGEPDFAFENQREELGFIYAEGDVNAAFADFDHDMDIDIAVASLYTGHYSRLYRNDGEAGFTDITYESATDVHNAVSVVWTDVDEDGDLDLIWADREDAPYVHLQLNRVGQDRNWIQLDLVGSESNRDAVGARVTLEAGGVSQLRDVKGGGGHSNTQSTRIVHFGLADETSLDQVTVRWPNGTEESIAGLAPNGRYRVEEGSGKGELLW